MRGGFAGTFRIEALELTNKPSSWDKRVLKASAANGGGSPPAAPRNAIRQVRLVTSTRARKLSTLCRQNDTAIGSAVQVTAKSD